MCLLCATFDRSHLTHTYPLNKSSSRLQVDGVRVMCQELPWDLGESGEQAFSHRASGSSFCTDPGAHSGTFASSAVFSFIPEALLSWAHMDRTMDCPLCFVFRKPPNSPLSRQRLPLPVCSRPLRGQLALSPCFSSSTPLPLYHFRGKPPFQESGLSGTSHTTHDGRHPLSAESRKLTWP